MASNSARDLDYKKLIAPLAAKSPWVLRVTEHNDKPVPVLVVKERLRLGNGEGAGEGERPSSARSVLRDTGLIYGQSLRRCLPVIRMVLQRVCDPSTGAPLELQRYFGNGSITFRGNLPLDIEAGTKLALMFKLQERVADLDRVELIARRVERFSREEAQYWLTRATQFSPEVNRWTQAGMRIMLGGQPGDKAIEQFLQRLQSQ